MILKRLKDSNRQVVTLAQDCLSKIVLKKPSALSTNLKAVVISLVDVLADRPVS